MIEIANENPLTDLGSGAAQLMSTAASDDLVDDPLAADEGGWLSDPLDLNPYTDVGSASGSPDPFVGRDVDPYTNGPLDDDNANPFTGRADINPFTGDTNTAPYSGDSASAFAMVAFKVDANANTVAEAANDVSPSISDTASDTGGSVYVGTVYHDGVAYDQFADIGGTVYEFPSDPSAMTSWTPNEPNASVPAPQLPQAVPAQISSPSIPVLSQQAPSASSAPPVAPPPDSFLAPPLAAPSPAPVVPPATPGPPTVVPSQISSSPEPDWTTQVDWSYTAPDSRLIQPVTRYDTGNRAANVLMNKLVLPLRNLAAFVENIPLAAMIGADDALKHSPFQMEYQAFQVMAPMEGALGLTAEVGPALDYLAASVSTSQRVKNIVTAPAYLFVGAGGMGGGMRGPRGPLRPELDALSSVADQLGVTYLGETPVASDSLWAQYQVYATGTDVEDVFLITRNGKSTLVRADAVTNNFLVEAKYGNLGQMWIPEREAHIVNQARNYLLISEQLDYRGIRYMVSDSVGAKNLATRFTLEFPEAVASGQLSVWWVP